MAYYNNFGQPATTGPTVVAQPLNYQNGGQITVPSQTNSLTIATVKGEEGAKNYPVAAGNTVLLIDFESNQFWLKSTAPNGMPQSFRLFTFEEQVPKTEILATDYVTKKELDDLKSYLENQFQSIKSQMNYKQKKFDSKGGSNND